MNPLTVLNVAYPFAPVAPETAGGAEQVLAMLDEALVAAGHQSLVLAAEGSRVAGELIASPPIPPLLDPAARRDLQFAYREQLLAILRTRPVDVVHFHGLDFAEYLPAVDSTYLATIHLPPGWYPPRTFELPVHLVWVSRDQGESAGLTEGELLPNGVRLDRFYPEGSRDDYVLAIGRICPEKGYHLAFDAATACGRRLLLAGQVFPYPEHQQYFEDEIRPRLKGNHLFLGPVCYEKKRSLLARAHCLVIPSQVRETSSLVAMEALACGTPVVGMRIGALPEIVDHGHTGWLVEKPEELPAAIEAASLINPADCRFAAEQRFSAKRMTRAYLRLYERLTTSGSEKRLAQGTASVVPPERHATRPKNHGSKSNIHVRAVMALAELRELESDWNRLWARCPQLTIFQSPDWLIPWVEVFAPSRLRVVEARREGRLVGLAPLFIYGTERDGIVAPLGAGITDYLDVLIDPEVPEALSALMKFLREHASEWTEVHFPDIGGDSLLLQRDALGAFDLQNSDRDSGREYDFDRQLKACEVCPQLDLPASIDELKTVVPAKQLRNLRAARRQLNGAQVQLATRDTLDEFLAALFRLHEKRWQLNGEAGVMSDPRVRELHPRVAARLLDRGVLRLFGLRYGGELIACLMAFFERDVARLYLQGYDPDYARASPGAQLVGAALEQAIAEKKRAVDFMRGRERYKYYWGSRDVPTFQLRVVSRLQAQPQVTEKSVA